MAEYVLKRVKLYWAGYEFSPDMHTLTLTNGAELVDATVFGSSCRKRKAGLSTVEVSAQGFWDASTDLDKVDNVLFNEIGSTSEPMTIIPDGTTALGELAFFTNAVVGEYSPSGTIGEMFGFNFAAYSEGKPLVRGETFETGTLSSAVTPTGQNLGIKTSTQSIYAAVHVKSVSSSGATVDVTVQIASSSSFVTDLSTALSLTQITDASAGTGQFASTIIASTKTNWVRFNNTYGSSDGDDTINALFVAGIY